MAKCFVTNDSLNEIKDAIDNLGIEFGDDIPSLKFEMQKLLATYKDYDLRSLDQIVKTIMEVVGEWGPIDPQFFNETNLANIITESNKGIQRVDPNRYNIDALGETKVAQTRKEANRHFLDEAYGTAISVRQKVEKEVAVNMVNAIIINRSKKDSNGRVVRGELIDNSLTMNQNIRQYKEYLLQQIINYLKSINSDYFKEDVSYFDNARMFVDNEYTGILERIRPYIDRFLNPKDYNAETLKMMQRYGDIRLNAYNAVVILDNFDTWLSNIFKDSIDIEKFNQHGEYSMSDNLAQITKTWKLNDEDHVEKQVSAFVQAIISTTPIYQNGKSFPIEGKFLKFNDFGYIISKLKKLAYEPEYQTTVINDETLLESLTDRTRDLVEGQTIAQVINKIRIDPQAYLTAIFELLSNPILQNNYNSVLFNKKLNYNDLDLIYSMYKGLFSTVDPSTSVASIVLQNVLTPNNYYEYIAQVADSIFKVDFIQYYTEDEMLKSRTMHSQSIDNIRRDLESKIQLSKTRRTQKPFELQVSEQPILNSSSIRVNFTIPETEIQVSVSSATGKVSYYSNGYTLDFINKNTFDKVIPFINEQLGIYLDEDLITAISEYIPTSELYSQLLSFACRVVMIDYINHTKLENTYDNNEIKNIAKNIIGDKVTINYQLNEINLIHDLDVSTLRIVAQAKGFLRGLERAAVVRDSEGNALSNITNSRLTGALHTQFETQCRADNSVVKDCLLMRRPEIFKGIYTTKEVKKDRKSKSHTNFSVSEFAYAHTVVDYISGLLKPKYTTSPIGNGVVALIPSVNSDKSTISRILIDLNQIVNGVAIKDMTDDQLMELIDSEFGTIYRNTYDNIQSDLDKVFLHLNELIPTNHKLYGSVFTNQVLDNFKTFNETCRANGLVPYDTLMEIVNNYNQKHKQNPIVFTDQVHFINNKGDLKTNPSLLGLLYRYYAINIPQNLITEYSLIRSDQFFDIKNKEVLKSLLDSGFELNVYQNESPELLYLRSNYSEWIDKAGDLILAKININGTTYKITNLEELNKLRGNQSVDNFLSNHKIELNPIHKRMNLLDSLFTQEFMDCTVGSFIAHPVKGKVANALEDAAGRFQAQHKRNVSMTASMHEFLLNAIKGIPIKYNIAIMEDVRDTQSLISGDVESGIKPFDGATFVNPFIVYLENNSLGGSKAGITKKQFIHFYDEHTGTGGIIKTAGFGLTNDVIRNSSYYQKMMERMTNREWPELYNVLEDFNGNRINYTQDLYFRKGGKFYQITNIEYVGDGQYVRTLQEVSEHQGLIGEEFKENPVKVDSNYKLWQLFGGYRSCNVKNNRLQYSETSIEKVVHAMNNVGTIISKDGQVKTGSDLYQPLKHTDIHYIPTIGAVKQGAANINKNLDEPLNFMPIRMMQAGIQLDKEHHADESELTLMTQVISACSSRGFTMESAQVLYKALADIAKINLKEFTNAFDQLLKGDKETIRNTVIKVVVDSLVNAQDTTSFIHKAASGLIQEAKEGKAISFNNEKIPVSANEVYSQFVSAVSVFMTNAGIKRKVAGILSVLTPSFGIMKLYNGKKYEQILEESEVLGYETVQEYLEHLQQTEAPIVYDNVNGLNRRNLLLGRTYVCTKQDDQGNITQESFKIQTPLQRKQLLSIASNYTSIKEDIRQGRDLGSYDAIFNGDLSIYDLDSVLILFELKQIESPEQYIEFIERYFKNSPYYGDTRLNDPKYAEKLIRRLVQRDLNALNPEKMGSVIINGKPVKVTTVETIPYEIIMPKTFATNFGLEEFDQLSDIVDNPDFFTNKLIQNYSTKALSDQNYDLELKNIRGEHILIALSSETFTDDMIDITDTCIIRTDESGVTYRYDIKGNELYQMKTGDRIFVDRLGNETIVTNNPQFYLDKMTYFDVKISQSSFDYTNKTKKLLSALKNTHNKQAYDFYKYITANGLNSTQIKEAANQYDIAVDRFSKIGTEIHNSFLQSLNIVAARIPAQSQQSFMPMKVVAFDNPDINTAYVSTAQILLQGSDYDIDAVSLATFAIDKTGKLPLWSPYADLSSYERLQESFKLPIPTGEVTIPTTYEASQNSIELQEFVNKIRFDFTISRGENDELILELNKEDIESVGNLISWVNSGRFKWPTDNTKQQLIKALQPFITNFNEGDLENLQSQFISAIDKHNLYMEKVGRHKQELICNNIITYKMFSIIANPANLLEAQSPVDATTDPLKKRGNLSANATALKTRSDGNFVNKMESIEDNQVGKKCIGICATGIKGFFGATQYCNWVIEHGTTEQQARLSFSCNINGKEYSLLANIRGELKVSDNVDPAIKSKLQSLAQKLQEVDQDSDAVLVLSAMLSLATDNAKELKLSQLNALEKTIGMYLYGISAGVNFDELADILMSPLALTMTQLMKGNTFTGKDNINSLDAVFDYFELGPDLSKYKQAIYDDNGHLVEESPLQMFSKQFRKKYNVPNSLDAEQGIMWVIDSGIDLNDLIAEINQFETISNNPKNKAMFYKLVKDITTYLVHKQLQRSNPQLYNDIKKLAQGAIELKELGQILGVNKGLQTSSEDLQRQVSTIEEIINGRVDRRLRELRRERKDRKLALNKELATDYQFNLLEFIQNPEYRERYIQLYENVPVHVKDSKFSKFTDYTGSKHFVNPLDIIATVPHYFEYVKSLAYANAALEEVSTKYRAIKPLSKAAKEDYRPTDSRQHLRNVQNLISNYISLNWRFQQNLTFTIPKGNVIYDVNGNATPLAKQETVQLGTAAGDLTFKAWMENEVFPNLQKGKLGTRKTPNALISQNEFVKALQQILYTNASDHQEKINTSLEIQMLPSDEYEQEQFDVMMLALEQLALYTYNDYPIIELLFLYNQIAFDGKLGQKSFTKMLQNYSTLPLIESYYDYIRWCDKNLEITLADIPAYMKHRHLAQFGNVNSSYAPYILVKNRKTGQVELMQKVDSRDEDAGITEKYSIAQVQMLDYSVPKQVMLGDQTATIEHKGGVISSIFYKGKTYDFKNDRLKVPYRKINGKIEIDTDLINSYIETKNNCQ